MTNHYPMSKGERPLFRSRQLLQSMHRSMEQTACPYQQSSASTLQVWNDIAAIKTIAWLIESTGSASSEELWPHVMNLPLFFSKEQVDAWEVQKVWKQYPSAYYFQEQYETNLSSPTPSDAYLLEGETNPRAWNAWFTHSEDIIATLNHSANNWLAWEKNRPNPTLFLNDNIATIGEKLSLTPLQCKAWATYCLFIHSNKELYSLLIKKEGIRVLFSIWENIMELPPHSIELLFVADSPLVKAGLYREGFEYQYRPDFDKEVCIQANFSSFLFRKFNDKRALLSYFMTPFVHDTLPLESWNYLGNSIPALVKAMMRGTLCVAVHGQKGKSSLIASLLCNTGKKAWTINVLDTTKEEEVCFKLQVCQAFLNSDDVLVFEDGNGFLEKYSNIAFNFINTSNSSIMLILEDVKKIQPRFLTQVDQVVCLTEMPLQSRVDLLKPHFSSEDNAWRVAQAVKNPQEINKVLKWCHLSEDYSWNNAFEYILNQQKILGHTKENLLTPITMDTEIAPLAGYEQLSDLLDKLKDYFNHPHKYRQLNAKTPTGILLKGPPGTGKTHFARHLVKEIGVPMFSADTSFLTEDPTHMEQLFNEARRHAPCVVFLDEIDIVINNPNEHGVMNVKKQKILNSFLMQLDGLHSGDGILVIGATHRNFSPDPAATRAGRMGETVQLTMPGTQARHQIWKAHLHKKPVTSIDYEALSQASSSFSPAEISQAINMAAIDCAHQNQNSISMPALLQACDRIFWGGVDNSMMVTNEEKFKTAIHEAGHALMAWKNGFKVNRITVRPRAAQLGAVNWEDEEGILSFGKDQLIKRIELSLAGIASEQVCFGFYTNGGGNDLMKTRGILRHMLLESGMGTEFHLSYSNTADVALWSERRKVALEEEERQLLTQAMTNVSSWLESNKDLLHEFAHFLLEEKEVSGTKLLYWQDVVNKQANPSVAMISKSNHEGMVLHKDETVQ